MIQLIRFEDDYGVHDLYNKMHNIDSKLTKLDEDRKLFISNDDTRLYEFGVTMPKVMMFDDTLGVTIKDYNVDEIVLVYDMDSPTGKGILTKETLEEYINNMVKALNRDGIRNLSIKLVPVVWAAETIALHLILKRYKYSCKTNDGVIDVANIVHRKNTPRCLGVIIDNILSNNGISKKSKHVGDYISAWDIKTNLLSCNDAINKPVADFILSDLSLNISEGINHQCEVQQYYQMVLEKDYSDIKIGDSIISLTKKCW